jgi:hypothetical protein
VTAPIFERRDGTFLATGHARGPWDPDAQHGGAPAALLVRALEEDGPGPGFLLARLTVEFLGTVPLAALRPWAEVVRPGRRLQLAEAGLRTEDGGEVCRARAVLLRRERVEVPPRSTAGTGAPPPPAEGRESPFPAAGENEGFHRTGMEIRFVAGDYGVGPATAWFRLRRPLVAGEPPSPAQLAAGAADFGNGISRVLDFERHLFVNTDLTVSLLRPPAGEWVAVEARTIVGPEGVGLSTSRLHDERGPLGTAGQTLFVSSR